MNETLDNLIIDLDLKTKQLKQLFEENLKILSDCDKKEEDLKHTIEFKTLKSYQRCNIITEYKKIRIERRNAKDNLDKIEVVTNNINRACKSLSENDRITNKVKIFEDKISNRIYNNRIYTEFDINKILN